MSISSLYKSPCKKKGVVRKKTLDKKQKQLYNSKSVEKVWLEERENAKCRRQKTWIQTMLMYEGFLFAPHTPLSNITRTRLPNPKSLPDSPDSPP